MLILLLLLCLLGVAFAHLGWRRCAWASYGLAFVLFLAAGCGPLPALLLRCLQAPYAVRPTVTWAQRNAIVLLGAGTTHVAGTNQVEPNISSTGRIIEAYALYRACRQGGNDCKLVVSGGDPCRHGVSEAVAYGEALKTMGVASADLLLESRSMNTWQNAQFVQPILKVYAPEQTLLVSSAIHLNRARLYFAHFGMDVTPVRGEYLNVRKIYWPNAWDMALTDFAVHEYVGVMTYRLYSMLGWNVPPSLH